MGYSIGMTLKKCMLRFGPILLISFVFCLLYTKMGRADTFSLDADKDVTVAWGDPYANQNGFNYLGVGYDGFMFASGGLKYLRSLLHFDLSSLPPNINISEAKLVLKRSLASGTGSSFSIEVYDIPEDWNEETVTWDDAQPYDEGTPITSLMDVEFDNPEFDITGKVQEWYVNPSANHGLLLKRQNDYAYDDIIVVFGSRENINFKPTLLVTYGSDVTPTRFRGNHFIDKTAKIGIPVLLEAKLEEDVLLNPDIEGETVHFDIYYNGSWHEISDDSISSTSFVTDSSGIASVYYTAPKSFAPGNYTVRARYDGSSSYESCDLTSNIVVKKPNWLVLVYLAADNELESFGIEDFYDEMWEARTNDEVSIVVLFDRRTGDAVTNPDWTSTRYFRISSNTNIYNDWGELNMGDQNTLQTFVDTALNQCSADHVALIFWNHGSGWKIEEAGIENSVIFDVPMIRQEMQVPQSLFLDRTIEAVEESFKAVCFDDYPYDSLSLSEIRGVLDNVTNNGSDPIDILGYDACLMGMLEVAYDASPYAKYLVASEDKESGDGWEYHLILGTSAIDSSTTPRQLGETIVNESIQKTLGCWDLTFAPNRFDEITNMANRLLEIFSESKADATFARVDSRNFQAYQNGPFCYVDLRQFASELAVRTNDTTLKSRAQALASGLADSDWRVAWKSSHTDASTLGGLSVYFPQDAWDSGDYANYFQNGYLLFTSDSNQYWDDFLLLYFDETKPICEITGPNAGGWHTGDIWVTGTANDDNKVQYVEFQYSLNNSNWYPLPGPDSPDGRDWYGDNGWGLTFRTTGTLQHGTIDSSTVWVRIRACDKAGNISDWNECNMPFGVDNSAPTFGISANTADPKPGIYKMFQTITDDYSGVRADSVYPRFYFRWNNSSVDASHYDGIAVGSLDGSYYAATLTIDSGHVGDTIFWRVRAYDKVDNEGWSNTHNGGVIQPPPEVCEGDFEPDGDVDGSDLAVFAADFGRTNCSGDCEGDFDTDGDVDGSDLATFAADFGRTNCPVLP